MTISAEASCTPIRCRSCACTDDITAIEHHVGAGEFYNVSLDAFGRLVLDKDNSVSASSPTGVWTLRCESCGHEWYTKRRP
jgi:hypothetical protein